MAVVRLIFPPLTDCFPGHREYPQSPLPSGSDECAYLQLTIGAMYRRLRSEKKDEWREGKENERVPLNDYRYVAIQTSHIGVDRGGQEGACNGASVCSFHGRSHFSPRPPSVGRIASTPPQ